jgi:peroxiredoxin
MLRAVSTTRALATLAIVLALGCGERSEAPAATASTAPAAQAQAEPAKPVADAPPARRNERPLPAFEGTTLDGRSFSTAELIGRRALIFFFNPEVPEAAPAADAVAHVAALRHENNFDVIGVAMAVGADAARTFARDHKLDFPIIDDVAAEIPARIGLRAPVALIGADADGYVTFAMGGPPADLTDAVAVVESQLREALRLPPVKAGVTPILGIRPPAPDFTTDRLGGGKPFHLASLRGKPVVLIFFLYTCPHCHHALEFLKSDLAKMPEGKRPVVLGVSVAGTPEAVRDRLQSDGLDFFTVLLDSDRSVRTAYGVLGGVPDIFLIDPAGDVVTRVQGWDDVRDPALMRMWLAKISGQQVPMLLQSTGYSGNDVCEVCHEPEYDSWLFTQHAHAFDTLVKHGADANPECIKCHVVGWDKPGGYTISPPTHHLENVGCEDCHGRGGPHLSKGFVVDANYEPHCKGCHDPTHSLGFDYATFLPKISHKANAALVASLPLAKRRALLQERMRPRSDILPTNADYVGSDACKSCHEKEYATWAASPHAHAMAALEKKGETRNDKCQACHVTAFGLPGGFPKGAPPADHADLARVGCEDCHGPGGKHVGADAPRVGTIVSLGDKCDSCVILQICGRCHDQANDPGFEFSVKEKIEAQKHGTIQPAASRGTGGSARLEAPLGTPGAWIGAVERGFAALDERG